MRAPSDDPVVWRTLDGGLVDEPAALRLLADGDLTVRGRVVSASNATLYALVSLDGMTAACVYKPVVGEQPLRDFPRGTLASREVAAYRVSVAGDFGVVPPTVLREGPHGVGSAQLWVEPESVGGPDEPAGRDVSVVTAGESTAGLVDVFPRDEVPAGWVSVLDALGPYGEPLALAHALDPRLATMATFDAVVNNADRKAGHVLAAPGDRVVGVDHGLTFHTEPKLRTVLWGFAGDAVADADLSRLELLAAGLTSAGLAPGDGADDLRSLVSGAELDVLLQRVHQLLAHARMPLPDPDRYVIPWPPF